MNELNDLTRQILNETMVVSLGTVDSVGVWVADVVFIYDDSFSIYWISKPDSRHSKAIAINPNIACTITASPEPNNERALQIEGTAKKLDGEYPDLDKQHFNKRGKPYLKHQSSAKPKGFSWYKLVPTKIELHWSEKFGYDRKSVL